jgi:AraC-like DNA-binding protein
MTAIGGNARSLVIPPRPHHLKRRATQRGRTLGYNGDVLRLDSHVPAGRLGDYVHDVWQCDCTRIDDVPPVERILPSGTVELVINLGRNEVRIEAGASSPRRYEGAVVSGTYSAPFSIDPRGHTSMLGVHFRPGGASRVLGVPAGELAGDHVELATLFGRRIAHELRERVCSAAPHERFGIIECFLNGQLARAREPNLVVDTALRMFGPFGTAATVREVARRVGLSHRRLIELFRAEVGLSPKRYCSILRFQRAVHLGSGSATPDWAGVAFDCGYCDQSHLIRDFVAFSGLRPSEFRRAQGRGSLRNHVPA